MIEMYTSSRGETMKIKDMANPYLIHAIASLAKNIAVESTQLPKLQAEELLIALKSEAIERLAPKDEK